MTKLFSQHFKLKKNVLCGLKKNILYDKMKTAGVKRFRIRETRYTHTKHEVSILQSVSKLQSPTSHAMRLELYADVKDIRITEGVGYKFYAVVAEAIGTHTTLYMHKPSASAILKRAS